jgi:tetratricopeptide (TPR) repeat protein
MGAGNRKSRPAVWLVLAALAGAAAMLAIPRLKGGPSAAPPPAASAADARSRAQALASAGRFREAIGLLQAAIRSGPYDEGLEYMLGEMMTANATPAEMVAFYSGEVEHDRKPQTSHYFWAMGLARSGDTPGAIGQLSRALEVDPAHEMSQRLWGVLLERQGELAPALSHYAEAIRIHPEFRDALQDAARVAAGLGRTAESEQYAARARAADPNTPRCFFYWARYLHEHGRDGAAWAEIQKGVAAMPGDAETLRLRDQIAAALGPARPPS